MSKKGENIYKRKDKRWEARYVKGYQENGVPKYGYCYGKTYREAKQKVTEAKSALLIGKATPAACRKQRFGVYCDEWLQMNRDRIKESTYVKYSNILGKHIKPHLGGCFLQTLSSVMVEQFSHTLLNEDKLAPKTVKDILTVLHAVLGYTAKQSPEPMQMIEVVYPKEPKKEMRVLTREEQTRFVQYLLQDMDACKFGVLLALMTGMRIGEVCALRWNNISLTEKTVKITSTMQRLRDLDVRNPEDHRKNLTKIVISDPKSGTSVRVIPLTDYAVRLCQAQDCSNPSAFVLTGEINRYMEPRAMQYRMEKYTKACGLADVHFHTLRHTFATRCVEVDFEIKSLSEILGHASPRITLERYVHSSMELKRDNMNKLASIGY